MLLLQRRHCISYIPAFLEPGKGYKSCQVQYVVTFQWILQRSFSPSLLLFFFLLLNNGSLDFISLKCMTSWVGECNDGIPNRQIGLVELRAVCNSSSTRDPGAEFTKQIFSYVLFAFGLLLSLIIFPALGLAEFYLSTNSSVRTFCAYGPQCKRSLDQCAFRCAITIVRSKSWHGSYKRCVVIKRGTEDVLVEDLH